MKWERIEVIYEICQQILEKIKEYDTIIIHRHMKPDPDALGESRGLSSSHNSFSRKDHQSSRL